MADNTIDTKSMALRDTYNKIIRLLDSADHISMNNYDIIKLIALLLYVKQHKSLLYMPNRAGNNDDPFVGSYGIEYYCFSNDINKFIDNDEFKQLFDSVIYNTHEAEASRFTMTLADIIYGVDLDNDDYLPLLDKLIIRLQHHRDIFYTHQELSLIMSSFINDNTKTVFNPFGGIMELATTLTNPNRHFVANEPNNSLREIALFRLAIAGILDNTEYQNKPLGEWTERVFDAIITVPPFGTRVYFGDKWEMASNGRWEAEQAAFLYFNKTTNNTGQLITVVPTSFLFSERDYMHNLREYITMNNWLDTIVLFPKSLFDATDIATAMIVLQKQRPEGEPIHFFDASNYDINDNLHSVINNDTIKHSKDNNHLEISKDVILRNNSSWNVGWYLFQHNTQYREGAEIVPLKNIFGLASSTNRFDDKVGHLVTGDVLAKSSVLKYEFRPENFSVSSDLKNTRKITQPVILVSSLSTYYPIFCEASEKNPIFIKSSIDAYTIKKANIHIGYLCMELHEKLTELSKYVSFYSNRRIYKYIWLSLPSVLEQQKSLYEEKKKTLQEVKLREIGYQNTVEGYKKQFRARKHAISQNLSAFSALWNTLYRFKAKKGGHLNDSDIVSVSYNRSVSDVFDALNERLKVILLQADHIADDEPDWGEPEAIELTAFIEEYIKTHSDIRFEFIHDGFDEQEYQNDVKLIEDDAWAKIIFPKKALIRIFENIISNAIDHGFADADRNDYKILISDQFVDVDCWTIRISNNGKPISDRFNLKKAFDYGYTTKSSEGHTGTGAYQVEELMKQFGSVENEPDKQGKAEIVSTPEELYTVTYVLTFRKTNII